MRPDFGRYMRFAGSDLPWARKKIAHGFAATLQADRGALGLRTADGHEMREILCNLCLSEINIAG
jgi:hypothetical protein